MTCAKATDLRTEPNSLRVLGVRAFRAGEVPCPRSAIDFREGPIARVLPPALDLEIGCGVGMHPLHYADLNPERTLIAIEHTRTRFGTFARAYAERPRKNLIPVHANAIGWVTHALPLESIDRCFLLYPNPYPKSQDLNKRWHAMPFMQQILAVLKPGGTLRMATNESFYIQEARQYFREYWKLEELSYQELRSGGGHTPRTHFEKKYLERGQVCFDLCVQKPMHKAPGA